MNSLYYRDTPEPLHWDGYDVEAQTSMAIDYIQDHDGRKPFAMVMSWGPPHNPYQAVPQKYLDMYPPEEMEIRLNCPEPNREDLSGFYAHVTALDDQLARLGEALEQEGLMDNTIFVYTSDHGDMIGSQSRQRKQHPWDESIHVPFVMRCPGQASAGHRVTSPFNVVDIMPTLLGLAGVSIPDTAEGRDHSPAVRGEPFDGNKAAYTMSIAPFAEFRGQPWRGLRTERYTYTRNLDGPWLLYDNEADPYQIDNLIGQPAYTDLQQRMENLLQAMMAERGDELAPALVFLDRYGYEVDRAGAVPYRN
jgi:arylsulfatase A-like enzyme